jgi:hypothetical protein
MVSILSVAVFLFRFPNSGLPLPSALDKAERNRNARPEQTGSKPERKPEQTGMQGY